MQQQTSYCRAPISVYAVSVMENWSRVRTLALLNALLGANHIRLLARPLTRTSAELVHLLFRALFVRNAVLDQLPVYIVEVSDAPAAVARFALRFGVFWTAVYITRIRKAIHQIVAECVV